MMREERNVGRFRDGFEARGWRVSMIRSVSVAGD